LKKVKQEGIEKTISNFIGAGGKLKQDGSVCTCLFLLICFDAKFDLKQTLYQLMDGE
jgi:hypothetical protein